MNDKHPLDNSDLDARIGAHLRAEAGGVTVPPATATTAIGIARRHRRRRHAAVAFGGAAAIALASITTVRVMDGSADRQVIVGSPVNSAEVVESDLEWTTSPAPIGLGYAMTTARDGNTMYALSTEPGQQPDGVLAKQALYRSTDGRTWLSTMLSEDLRVSGLAANAGAIYAVGTAPSANPPVGTKHDPGEVVVATSRDGGASWTRSALPVDLGAVEAFTSGRPFVHAEAAVGASGVVVLANVQGHVDPKKILPASADYSWGWRVDLDGLLLARPTEAQIEAYVASRCGPGPSTISDTLNPQGGHVTCGRGSSAHYLSPQEGDMAGPDGQKYTWVELGVDAQTAVALGGTPLAFRSTDGVSFAPATLDAPSGWATGLVALPKGFVAALNTASAENSGIGMMWSADGSNWTPTTSIVDSYPVQLANWRGQAVLISQAVSGETVTAHTSVDGLNWTDTDLASVLDLPRGAQLQVEASGTGGLGLVLGIATRVDVIAQRGGVTITHGDVTLRLNNRQGSATALVGGSEIASSTSIFSPTRSGRLVMRTPSGSTEPVVDVLGTAGETLATFSLAEITTAMRGVDAASVETLVTPPVGQITTLAPTTAAPNSIDTALPNAGIDSTVATRASLRRQADPGASAEPTVVATTTATTAPPIRLGNFAGMDDSLTEHFLLRSIDGQKWSKVKLADIVGQRVVSVSNIVVTDERIVATVTLPDPTGAAPIASQRTLVIATPKQ
jgi:hypothetical protein